MHYLFALLWKVFDRIIESHNENHKVFMMKTVWLSYLHLSNILLNWVELSTQVLEFNFSTQLNTFSKKFQLNSTLFESSTRLDAISLHSCTVDFILRSTFNIFRWISSFIDIVNECLLNIINHSCSSMSFILQSAFNMFCWILVHTYTVNERLLDIINHSYTV